MKMYTNESQTAKLIELGFEKPKSEIKAEQAGKCAWYNPAYSIGELIEMLPEAVCLSNDDSVHYYLEIYSNALYWNVAYKEGPYEAYSVECDELIDALYITARRLKEEGVV